MTTFTAKTDFLRNGPPADTSVELPAKSGQDARTIRTYIITSHVPRHPELAIANQERSVLCTIITTTHNPSTRTLDSALVTGRRIIVTTDGAAVTVIAEDDDWRSLSPQAVHRYSRDQLMAAHVYALAEYVSALCAV